MRRIIVGIVSICAVLLGIVTVGLAAQQQTIKLAHIYDPAGGGGMLANYDWIKEQVVDFEREFPDVKIQLEQFIWDQIDTKMMSDYKAGVWHDVTMSMTMLMPQHFVVDDLLNLTPYINKWTAKEYRDFAWHPSWKKFVKDDMIIAVPLGMHTRQQVYRRDMFEEVGLDPNAPPETLDQLINYAKRLTRDTDGDGTPDIWGLGMYLGPQRATIELYFAPYLWYYGGQLWDPATEKAVFASEAGVKTAKFLYDLIYTHKVTPEWAISGLYDEVIATPFLNNKYGMAGGWGNYWIEPLQREGFAEGVSPPTTQAKGTVADLFICPKGTSRFTNTWSISIHKLTKNADLSFKLLESIIRPDSLWTFPDAGLPARRSLWQRPAMKTDFYLKWAEVANVGRPMPSTARYMELSDTVAVCLQEIIAQKAPIQATLEKFQDEYNRKYAGQ